MSVYNPIHVESVPDRYKVTTDHLLKLHNQLKDTMAQTLLQDNVFDIHSGIPYILNCVFDDINRIRIMIFDLIENGESLNINIEEVYIRFKRLTKIAETSTNSGLAPQIRTYIDVWNTFVHDCNQ